MSALRPTIKWTQDGKHRYFDGDWELTYKLGVWTLCKEGVPQAAGTRLEMFNKRRVLQKLVNPVKSVDYRTHCNRSVFALMRDCDEECLDIEAKLGDEWVPLCGCASSKKDVLELLVLEPENMANVRLKQTPPVPEWLVAGARVYEPLHGKYSLVRNVDKREVTHRRDGDYSDATHAWHPRRFVPAFLRPYEDGKEMQEAMDIHGDKVRFTDGSVLNRDGVVRDYDDYGLSVDNGYMNYIMAAQCLEWADRHAFGIYGVGQ